MGSESGRAVKRIEDVRLLRQLQFPEDAGPMAHPIRPDEYQEINNFYTVTVYEKGAEVVRMYQTLLGVEGFRKGMDLYFKRHDGQAVTCDDFLAAMADANDRDLSQFKNWYSQAGTPKVEVQESYDADKKQYQITLTQSPSANAEHKDSKPFHIPLKMRLLTPADDQVETLLELNQDQQTWTFDQMASRPVLSINRNFSAPINLGFDQSESDLLTMFSSDDDAFNRWEAGQKLAMQMILGNRLPDKALIEAYRALLTDPELDPAFKELSLTLPAETYLYEQCASVDPQRIYAARRAFRHAIASELRIEWAALYRQMQTPGPFNPDAASAGKRALKNLALSMLLEADPLIWAPMAVNQYQNVDNMTDRYAALAGLVIHGCKSAAACLEDFYTRFADDALVIDKWFALQSGRPPVANTESTLSEVKHLREHEAFKMNNPNRVRSVIHAFCMNNPASFHQVDGSGYAFWAESVLALDPINPQVAARLARGLDRWRQFAPVYQEQMLSALRQVAACETLSADVKEVVSKALGNSIS
jgi:aminopeptidase N